MKNNDVALITIIHDIKGLIYRPLSKVINLIKAYFPQAYVAVSNQTSEEIINILKQAEFKVFIIEKKGVANARRKIAEYMKNYSHEYYHYCDLDRLVTWFSEYPNEISLVKQQIIKYDYLIIGRTLSAFNSHPVQWKDTEHITNRVFSYEFRKNVDVTAGSCGMSRKSLLEITDKSKAKMTDAEWPLIIRNSHKDNDIGYIEVNGLKYLEYNKSQSKNELDEWTSRTRLTYLICQSINELKRAHK
ncbi:hypothetical protein QGM71_03390 [Virgibacillus sp. C22-A2]|uniref:Glycosyltransferase n=1 Tax=Virgibacillus tibetensis TaxID=3042313 RepID=A0ABU6KBL0_9BACI|nr:hypothetical protein [Virgibacillus sp. C22-A2]